MKKRVLADCMEAVPDKEAMPYSRISCRKGYQLPKVAILRKAEHMACTVCQACPDFNDADR